MSKPRLKPLPEQVIVITGATSGIGLATARVAAERRAKLVLAARHRPGLDQLADELRRLTEVETVEADVGREPDVRRIATAARARFGGFDTWVNNAGITIYGQALDTELDDERRLFDTNFWGVVHGSRVAAEALRARGGALINVGSVVSDAPVPLQAAYSASKHAVKAYTNVLRMELAHASAPISVTLIKPGAIDTPFFDNARNLMRERPRGPDPVYDPRLVARAILHAAENPTRELYVGGGGAVMALFARFMPGVAERMMGAVLFEGQKRNEADRDTRDSLHAPTGHVAERGFTVPAIRRTSLFTAMQKHPWVTAGLMALAGVAASWLRPRRRTIWGRR